MKLVSAPSENLIFVCWNSPVQQYTLQDMFFSNWLTVLGQPPHKSVRT